MVISSSAFFLSTPVIAQRFVGYSTQVFKSDLKKAATPGATLIGGDTASASRLNTGNARWVTALLGDGDFSKSITESSGKAPKAGSLGVSFTRNKEYWLGNTKPDEPDETPELQGNILITLGAQGDTLGVIPDPLGTGRATNQYSFGQALLIPGSNARAARSFTGALIWRPHILGQKYGAWLQGLGYNGFLNVTQTRWSYQNKIEDVRLMALSVGLTYTVFDLPAKEKEDNSLRLDLLLNYSLRHISGDIREEKEILRQAFGSGRYWYSGVEPSLVFSVNSLRLSASFPFYQGNIKGFSNGQFVASVGFSTALNLTK